MALSTTATRRDAPGNVSVGGCTRAKCCCGVRYLAGPGRGFCRLALLTLVMCMERASAAQLGPPRHIWDAKGHRALFRVKVLAGPAPQDVTLASWDFDDGGLWPMGERDPNVEELRIASGELRFRMVAPRVHFGWGSFGRKGGAALAKTRNAPRAWPRETRTRMTCAM